jgi:hypothetical protein
MDEQQSQPSENDSTDPENPIVLTPFTVRVEKKHETESRKTSTDETRYIQERFIKRHWQRFINAGGDRQVELILALAITFFSAAQWITSCANNSSTTTQTNQLIRAANINACAARRIAAASNRNATAAESFATTAGLINGGIGDAVKKLETQAKEIESSRKSSVDAAQKALQVSIDNSRLDERAWIGIGDAAVTISATEPFKVTMTTKNVGKTPATDMISQIGVADKPKGEELTLADIKYSGEPSQAGTLFPSAAGVIGKNLDSVVIGQENDVTSWKNGDKIIYVFAATTYNDIFNKSHWTHACVIVQKDLKSSHTCNIYNDSDADTPVKKH